MSITELNDSDLLTLEEVYRSGDKEFNEILQEHKLECGQRDRCFHCDFLNEQNLPSRLPAAKFEYLSKAAYFDMTMPRLD